MLHTTSKPAEECIYILEQTAQQTGLVLTEPQKECFIKYFDLLIEWNTAINLTRITRPEDVAIKHFVDSLMVSSNIELYGRIVDIGTGAGFPGLPLAITNPDVEMILVEKNRKKINFLKHVIKQIGIRNTKTVCDKAERCLIEPKSDFALTRAFSDAERCLKTALPLVKDGGFVVLMKGKEVFVELTGCSPVCENICFASFRSFCLPRKKGIRTIVGFQKCFT